MKKLLSVASARPNFVKLAAIHHAWSENFCDVFEHVIVHTGQHYDPLLSDIFFTQLEIPQPNHHLGIHGGTRDEAIQRTKEALLPVLTQEKPDCVLVYGDVNGACAAAHAAYQLGIPVAHVEAGLRSGDLEMPEELNRIEIDRLSQYLFCTEQSGIDHLNAENVSKKTFRYLVGNTMIDTLVRMMPLIEKTSMLDGISPPFGIVTLHRPSNVDHPATLEALLQFLHAIAVESSLQLVLPMHHRLQQNLEKFGLLQKMNDFAVHLIEPQGYVPFLHLMKHCAFVLTDSGGMQEEAVFLQKRCFTLRRNTERPVTIECGSNILIDPAKPEERRMVLAYAQQPAPLSIQIPTLWDGHAGERILAILASLT